MVATCLTGPFFFLRCLSPVVNACYQTGLVLCVLRETKKSTSSDAVYFVGTLIRPYKTLESTRCVCVLVVAKCTDWREGGDDLWGAAYSLGLLFGDKGPFRVEEVAARR